MTAKAGGDAARARGGAAGHLFKPVIFNVAALLAIFVGGEIACRALRFPYRMSWIPSENALAAFDPELGWSYVPGRSRLLRFGDGRSVLFAFDGNGLRVPQPGFAFDGRTPSVLFVGCSYTFGHGLSYEQSFVGQLAARGRGDLQYVNLGVQAYGTDQSLLALRRHLPRFNAKTVVYTFLEDDEDGHAVRNSNFDRRQLYPETRHIGTKPLFVLGDKGEVLLARKPILFAQPAGPGSPPLAVLAGLLNADYPHSWLLEAVTLAWRRVAGALPPSDLELTRALLLEMRRYCREHGADFIVLRWRYRDNPAMDALFAGTDLAVVDTLATAPAGWDTMKIQGVGHPDERAAAYVADLLGPRLGVRMGL